MASDEILVINFDDTLKETLGHLEHFETDQLPYAIAGALMGVGIDAKRAMQDKLAKKFTIRTKGSKGPWAARALYVCPEKVGEIKKNIISGKGASIMVATRDSFGRMLTDGGIKKYGKFKSQDGKRPDGEFGIPIIGGARRNVMTIIRFGRNSPGDYEKNKKAFIVQTKDGRRLMVMPPKKYRKNATGKRGKRVVDKTTQNKALFHMRAKVQIKPWWDLRKILSTAMLTWLPQRFAEACSKAMETRKPRA